MLTINKKRDGDRLTVSLIGRLDTNTAPQLEKELDAGTLKDVKELVLDFEQLAYISSAGLRVLLTLYKSMLGRGSMKLLHVNEDVNDVFVATGFANVLTIE